MSTDFWQQLVDEMQEGIRDLRMLPDDRVTAHAQGATMLGIIERKPPGWTEAAWTLYLMDLSYRDLRDRLYERATALQGGALESGDVLDIVSGPKLPVMPDKLPAKVAVKMWWLQRKWLGEYIMAAVAKGLVPFKSQQRSERGLREAHTRVKEILFEICGQVGMVLDYHAKLTWMRKEGIKPTLIYMRHR